MNKYKDAIDAQAGACNPVALANAFTRHATPILLEHGAVKVRNDVALRLIVHQLAFLMRTNQLDEGNEYHIAMELCENKAEDEG